MSLLQRSRSSFRSGTKRSACRRPTRRCTSSKARHGRKGRDPFASHWSEFAEEKGKLFRSDDRGRVRLPAVQRSAIVSAHTPGRFGILWLGRRHKKVETILLRPDETLRVKVVDEHDRPVVGAPVAILQTLPQRQAGWRELSAEMKQLEQLARDAELFARRNPQNRAGNAARLRAIRASQEEIKVRLGSLKRAAADKKAKGRPKKSSREPSIVSRKNVRARARTNVQGLAVFRHFQIHRRNKAPWWPPQLVDRFEAVVLAPLQEVSRHSFAGRPVPKHEIVLRMPATGSIALRAVDAEGRPFRHPFSATLRVEGAKAAAWTRVSFRSNDHDGLLVFPFVGLGLRLSAQCRLDDDDFRWNSPVFAGPRDAGQRVEHKLVVAPGMSMLRGRVVDTSGKPLARTKLSFLINARSGRLEGEDILSDGEGRFHLPYKIRDSHQAPFRLVVRRRGVHPTSGLSRALPRLQRERITELGDLHISPFGRFAAGKVLDDRGEAILNATLQLQREREVGRKERRMAFVDEAFTRVRSQADGSYELFADPERGRYRLRVSARDHFPLETRALRRGETHDVRLTRKSRLVGSVLLPDWLPSRSVRITVESAGNAKFRREDRIRDHRGKKYILFDWMRPGSYTVTIRVRDFPGPVLNIPGIRLAAGQTEAHPALSNLDLRRSLHRFELLAVDSNGKAIHPNAPLLARILRADGTSGLVGFAWRGARCEIYSRTAQLALTPLASGYRAAEATVNAGKSRIRFAKIPQLSVDAKALRQRIGTTSAWLRVSLIASQSSSLEAWDARSRRMAGWFGKLRHSGYARLGADGRARLSPVRDGRYAVEAWVGNKSKGVKPVRVALGQIDVRLVPGAPERAIPINITPATLDSLLAQLSRNRPATKGGR